MPQMTVLPKHRDRTASKAEATSNLEKRNDRVTCSGDIVTLILFWNDLCTIHLGKGWACHLFGLSSTKGQSCDRAWISFIFFGTTVIVPLSVSAQHWWEMPVDSMNKTTSLMFDLEWGLAAQRVPFKELLDGCRYDKMNKNRLNLPSLGLGQVDLILHVKTPALCHHSATMGWTHMFSLACMMFIKYASDTKAKEVSS